MNPIVSDGEVERDTWEDEDVPNVMSLVILPAEIMRNCSLFGMAFYQPVFDGWVKQPSACCAAAAVAGAWNALHRLHRRNPGACTHLDVVQVSSLQIMDGECWLTYSAARFIRTSSYS
jgi:hypothetical protein